LGKRSGAEIREGGREKEEKRQGRRMLTIRYGIE
jgi:hypothetical protein